MSAFSLASKVFLGLVIFVLSVALLLPGIAAAQGIPSGGLQPPPGGVPGPGEGFGTVEELFALLKAGVQWLLVFAVVIGVIFIIVGGIKYVTAGGNQEQAGQATKMIAFAAVGIAIILLAFILVNVVANIIGVTPPEPVF